MLKRLLLPAAAAAIGLGAAVFQPAPANAASIAGAASFTHSQAQTVSDIVEVSRRHRHAHRHHGRHHHRHHHYARPFYFAPYAYAPRRCGYVWNHRLYQHVWRCW